MQVIIDIDDDLFAAAQRECRADADFETIVAAALTLFCELENPEEMVDVPSGGLETRLAAQEGRDA